MAALSASPPLFFDVRVVPQGTARTITLCGEIDVAAAPAVRAAIDEALMERPELLVIDLGETTFIDSTGVHLLLSADAGCRELGIRLVLLPAADGVQQVVELAGLSPRLPFVSVRTAGHREGRA